MKFLLRDNDQRLGTKEREPTANTGQRTTKDSFPEAKSPKAKSLEPRA